MVAAAHGAVGIDEGGDGEHAPDGDEGLFFDSADDFVEGLFIVEIPGRGVLVGPFPFFPGLGAGGETNSLLSNDDGKGRSAMVIGSSAGNVGGGCRGEKEVAGVRVKGWDAGGPTLLMVSDRMMRRYFDRWSRPRRKCYVVGRSAQGRLPALTAAAKGR